VDQATRDDIAAAAAAHHELGRDYDSAVAEGLIDRIGAEIDKRVDAKLRAASSVSRSPAWIPQAGMFQAAWVGAIVGAGIIGLAATIADGTDPNKNVTATVWAIWAFLATACLVTSAVRWYRNRAADKSTETDRYR
jgi:hypothetical protein